MGAFPPTRSSRVTTTLLDTLHFLYRREQFADHDDATCLACRRIFPCTEIVQWIDGDTTPVCPRCAWDFVVPGRLATEALEAARGRAFEPFPGMEPMNAVATGRRRFRPSERRALLLALAGAGTADGTRPGPAMVMWNYLQMSRMLDPLADLPSSTPPEVTDLALRCLGLPERVDSPLAALRAAVRHLLPWRRPAVRTRGLAVSIDDPDDEQAPPLIVSALPTVIAGVSTDNEIAWEQARDGRSADTVWDAVYTWSSRVGFPLDSTARGEWRLIFCDVPPPAGA